MIGLVQWRIKQLVTHGHCICQWPTDRERWIQDTRRFLDPPPVFIAIHETWAPRQSVVEWRQCRMALYSSPILRYWRFLSKRYEEWGTSLVVPRTVTENAKLAEWRRLQCSTLGVERRTFYPDIAPLAARVLVLIGRADHKGTNSMVESCVGSQTFTRTLRCQECTCCPIGY